VAYQTGVPSNEDFATPNAGAQLSHSGLGGILQTAQSVGKTKFRRDSNMQIVLAQLQFWAAY
jgi:hypothetical protein